MLRKKFVSKSNENRFNLRDLDNETITFQEYNKHLIYNEFAGYKFYGLICPVPKAYISVNNAQNYQINTSKIESSKTLKEYLYDILKKFDSKVELHNVDLKFKELIKNPEKREKLAIEINKIQGLGELCFMAMLLGDRDVFGARLDNVRVCLDANKKPYVVKLDPADVDLIGEQFTNEEFSAAVERRVGNQGFFADSWMPYFDAIYDLLDDKQKEAGIKAIERVSDAELQRANNWIGTALAFDKDYQTKILETLSFRRKMLVSKFNLTNIRDEGKVKEISQNVIFRPAEDFEDTGKSYSTGNAKPKITKKVRSEKKERELLRIAKSQIEYMIGDLERKAGTLANQKGKESKKALLAEAVKQLNSLKDSIDPDKWLLDTRYELVSVFKKFNTINDELIRQLKDDVTEKGVLRSIRRNIVDAFRGLKSSPNYSSIQTVMSSSQAVNNHFFDFFKKAKLPIPEKLDTDGKEDEEPFKR